MTHSSHSQYHPPALLHPLQLVPPFLSSPTSTSRLTSRHGLSHRFETLGQGACRDSDERSAYGLSTPSGGRPRGVGVRASSAGRGYSLPRRCVVVPSDFTGRALTLFTAGSRGVCLGASQIARNVDEGGLSPEADRLSRSLALSCHVQRFRFNSQYPIDVRCCLRFLPFLPFDFFLRSPSLVPSYSLRRSPSSSQEATKRLYILTVTRTVTSVLRYLVLVRFSSILRLPFALTRPPLMHLQVGRQC